MAAPVTTARVTPVGIMLKEGHPVQYAFARAPNVGFWEKVTKPPGVDGGAPIEQTTSFNVLWETQRARALKKITDGSTQVAYDPAVLTTIINTLVNAEGSITCRFPDGTTVDFFGFLQKFEPQAMKPGEQPMADVNIVCTNWDPVNRVEQGPVITSVAGT